MKINLEVNNLAKNPFKETFFLAVAKKTFNESGLNFLEKKNIAISLAIVSEKEIQKLNKKYRKIDKPTDVLSFAECASAKELKRWKEQELFLGEIILCYDDIRKYAVKERLKLKKEVAKVFAHGLLHLLGFQHGKNLIIYLPINNTPKKSCVQ